MKVIVVGALLWQTIDAQTGNLAGLLAGDPNNSPAPLLIPGVSAPAESELFPTGTPAASTRAGVGANLANAFDSGLINPPDFLTAPLPVGTADVVIESSSAVSEPKVLSDLVGGNDLGIFATPLINFPPIATNTAGAVPSNIFDVLSSFATAEPGLPLNDVASSDVFANAPAQTIEPDWSIDTSSSNEASTALATNDLAFPDFDATGGILDPGFGAAAATSDDSLVLPEETPSPDLFADEPLLPGLDSSSLVPLPDATDVLDGLVLPATSSSTSSDALATGSSAFGAQAAAVGGGGGSPMAWSGEDTGNYDGQDYGEGDNSYDSGYDSGYNSGYEEECPSYCLEGGDYPADASDDAYPPSYPQPDDDYSDDSGYSMIRKLFRRLTRRQSSGGGFASFQWPSAPTTSDDHCEEDVPGWLYQTYSERSKPCKPKCPASCYKKPDAEPYPYESAAEGYTSEPKETYEPYTTDPYETYTTDSYETYTTDPYETYTTDTYEPHPTGDPWNGSWGSGEPWVTSELDSTGPWSSVWSNDTTVTSTSTQTTFVTSVVTWKPYPPPTDPYPPQSSPSDSYSSGSSGGYDGDTLATVCPKQCNPFDPAANKCDYTSSCTVTASGKYYCACRAGFRASAWNEKDFSKQFKLDGQPYVFTAEGVVCDKVCNDLTCTEVLSRPLCQ